MSVAVALSILLPTFNGERFLAEQVHTILAQSWGDFELLVVDDGSTDGTPALLASLAPGDARLRVLPSHGNRGQKARLAQLREEAHGALLAIADQDDRWDEHKVERLIAALGDRDLAFGQSTIIDAAGVPTGHTLLDLLPPAPSPGDRLVYLFKPMVSAHAAVARRALYRPDSFARTHPFDWLQSLDAVFGRGLVYVPDAVTFHRIHGANQSNANAGVRRSALGRLDPAELRRKRNLKLTERWMFHQRLEHLAFSPHLSDETRGVFARAHRAVARQWFEQDRRWSLAHRALEMELLALLTPLAGSDADLAVARKWLRRLCRANVHPLNIAFHAAVTAIGARKARASASAPS